MKKEHRWLLKNIKFKENFEQNKIFNNLNSSSSNAYSKIRQLNRPTTKILGTLKMGIRDGSRGNGGDAIPPGSMTIKGNAHIVRIPKNSWINPWCDRFYTGDSIPDWMFNSIRNLKNWSNGHSCTSARRFRGLNWLSTQNSEVLTDYQHRIEKQNSEVSFNDATKILNLIKKSVNDFYSFTSLHYLHAGQDGIIQFQYLINAIISNINLANFPKMNTIYACILFKGHLKSKENGRLYRTISTCPL